MISNRCSSSIVQSERIVEVRFSREDAKEYKKLEKATRDGYLRFKSTTKKVGTGFLKLSQMLLPLRVACAGGKSPLPSDCGNVEVDDGDDD